jgi:5,10-methylenetetrahydromethanopterin reductase
MTIGQPGPLHGRIGIVLVPEFDHVRLAALSRQIEELGFGTLWYADERFYRDTYVGLAVCATSTSTIRLGPGVSDPFTRHPATIAQAMGSLQELSSGRAVLGLGAGNIGFENLGLQLKRPAVAMRDAIDIIRGMLDGGIVTHTGEMISVSGVQMAFVPPAPVPIYLSAGGPHMRRLAGEVADGVFLMHAASERLMSGPLEEVRAAARRAGRSMPRVVARLDVAISRDGDAAMAIAKARIARQLWKAYPNIDYLPAHGLVLPEPLDALLQAAGPFVDGHGVDRYWPFVEHIPDEFVYPIILAGSPSQIARQLESVLAGAVDEFMLYLLVPRGETIESCLALLGEAADLTAVPL